MIIINPYILNTGIHLPIFPVIGGALQHLFSSNNSFEKKADGFTYVKDVANEISKDARLVESACVTTNGVDDIGLTGISADGITSFVVESLIKSSGDFGLLSAGDSNARRFHIARISNIIYIGIIENGLLTYGSRQNQNFIGWARLRVEYDGSGINNVDKLKLYVNDDEMPLFYWGDIPSSFFNNSGLSFEYGCYWGASKIFTSQSQCDLNITINGVKEGSYPMAEGGGLGNYDVSGSGNHSQLVGLEASLWAEKQDIFHYNIINGWHDGVSHFPYFADFTLG